MGIRHGEYGGLNFPRTIFILIEDVVSRADAAFGNLWGLQDCAETILAFGSKEQQIAIFPVDSSGENAQ